MSEKTRFGARDQEFAQSRGTRSPLRMASGSSRYVRYVLFAFFVSTEFSHCLPN